jgi:type I restriction enzyme S subunit
MDNCQLPKGYKNTEVGVIPVEWEIVSFETIADKSKKWSITGGPFGSNLKASDYTDDGIQIIQLQNIGDGEFIDDYQIFTSDTKANELISCNIYPGEIILSKMGDPVARACFIPNKAKRFVMASDGIRLVVNERDFSKKLIHDYINSIYFRKRAFEISTGSTRLRIGLPELKSLLVIKPPKAEQTAIATALSDADALINSLEKLIAKKRNIKQGAMQRLIVNGELLMVNEEYVKVKLGDVCEFSSGTAHENFIDDKGDYIVVNSKFISTDGEVRKYSKTLFCPAKNNDILIVLSDVPNGKAIAKCFFVEKENTYTVNQRIGIVKPQNIDSKYLFYLLNRHKDLLAFDDGAKQTNLRNQDVLNLQLTINNSPLKQAAIAECLSDIDAEIQALETKLEKYRKIKLGMMQNLLTGKIRLIDN